ncbi:O-acetylhomoserine aminocarboxypropyltransferase/cysteine synthase family protein [Microbacterium sp. SORGH_AS_0888]|uniref:O-acetylhomoserine aminocarboxypropyltransferase/cysteine synthase family protein n=1 Tax=Microbacterium sp. SORGH_AS_0888 TaxID=3041791 RepID=UPI00277E690B|nr:aminotransferase class I/II-fold pyridoxal phosphate-dependent enzyme [Microbacterium sp. SORGH_AS_0888]MDQ1128369.1 O-acetylhomoserine (thiol)-lyase [Microbacterium sp. SORGH_AS_0888]
MSETRRTAAAGFATRQVHAGTDWAEASPRALPIFLTAGFRFDDVDAAADHFRTGAGFGYTRTGNPTIDALERRLADLEGGAEAVFVASGQAAVSVALLALVGAGDHIVCANQVYEGTRGLLLDNLARLGIETTFVADVADPDAWRAARRPTTRAFFAESISNARNDVLDIAAISAVADEHGIPLVVDNTFATPYLLRPIEHGAAVVVHSASKFLAGQGAALGGVVVDDGRFDAGRSGSLFPHLVAASRSGGPSVAERHGGRARIGYLRETVAPRLGPSASPLNAFLVAQGVETLSLRVREQSRSALTIARWLAERPEVARVDYAGLPTHPHHPIARRYLPRGYGSVFQATLAGGEPAARRLIETLEVFTHMTHLGDVRSLVLHPASTSHAHLDETGREAVGVAPGTVRFSIGIEDADDLVADLERGLRAASLARPEVAVEVLG